MVIISGDRLALLDVIAPCWRTGEGDSAFPYRPPALLVPDILYKTVRQIFFYFLFFLVFGRLSSHNRLVGAFTVISCSG